MSLDKSFSNLSLNKDNEENQASTRVMPPRHMPPRMPPGGRSVLPPMSGRPGALPPLSAGGISGGNSPVRSPLPGQTPSPGVGGMRNRPGGGGRMGRPGLNLSQLGLSPKPEQTPFANFSKYVLVNILVHLMFFFSNHFFFFSLQLGTLLVN